MAPCEACKFEDQPCDLIIEEPCLHCFQNNLQCIRMIEGSPMRLFVFRPEAFDQPAFGFSRDSAMRALRNKTPHNISHLDYTFKSYGKDKDAPLKKIHHFCLPGIHSKGETSSFTKAVEQYVLSEAGREAQNAAHPLRQPYPVHPPRTSSRIAPVRSSKNLKDSIRSVNQAGNEGQMSFKDEDEEYGESLSQTSTSSQFDIPGGARSRVRYPAVPYFSDQNDSHILTPIQGGSSTPIAQGSDAEKNKESVKKSTGLAGKFSAFFKKGGK